MTEHHPDDAYHPEVVETKWQARWAERHTNEPDLDGAPRPFYNLMMFPYPSAEGLHVGNFFAFTGADVYGRFKRLQGYSSPWASMPSVSTAKTLRSASARILPS